MTRQVATWVGYTIIIAGVLTIGFVLLAWKPFEKGRM